MRHKKSIKAWFIGSIASVVKFLAPALSIKRFTKSSFQYADLFLPGKEKELQLMKKLELTDSEIKARVWSLETRVSLLTQGNGVLAGQAETRKELEAAIATNNATIIIAVMRVVTPNKKELIAFINESESNVVFNVLMALFNSVFRDVTVAELMDVKVSSKTPFERRLEWLLHIPFDSAGRITELFEFLGGLPASSAWSIEGDVVVRVLPNVIAAKVDCSCYLPLLRRRYPSAYKVVCNKDWTLAGHPGAVMLPYVVSNLTNMKVNLLDCSSFFSINSLELEAFKWLGVCCEHIANQRVGSCVLAKLSAIKAKVDADVYQQLCEIISLKVTGASNLREAFAKLPEIYHNRLIERFVENAESYLKDRFESSATERFLNEQFPFANWEAEQAKKAVRLMVKSKVISIEKFAELSEELKAEADGELILQSQIAYLKGMDDSGKYEALIFKLSQRAEEYLLCGMSYNAQEIKLSYVTAFVMDPTSFYRLVEWRGDNYTGAKQRVESVILAHAEAHGLSADELRALQMSSYDYLAPKCKQSE